MAVTNAEPMRVVDATEGIDYYCTEPGDDSKWTAPLIAAPEPEWPTLEHYDNCTCPDCSPDLYVREPPESTAVNPLDPYNSEL